MRYRAKQTEIGNFRSFFAFYPPKNQILKNEKICWRYHHFTQVHQKSQSYVWFLRYGVRQTKNFLVLGHFLPFYLPNNSKNQNFEKMKKLPGDIILHRCNINDNYMMYDSRDTEHDRQNSLSFWTIFCPFTSLTTQKINI